MKNMEVIEKVIDTVDFRKGPYSFRLNGESEIVSSDFIKIEKIENGLSIEVFDSKKEERFYLPVLINKGGYEEKVINKIKVNEGAVATIIAGCAICHSEEKNSAHKGVHEIKVLKNATLNYFEKHHAKDDIKGAELSPSTTIWASKGSTINLSLSSLGGVQNSDRKTIIHAEEDVKISINERILTDYDEKSCSEIVVYLNGRNSSAEIVSRSVARGNSVQKARFLIVANDEVKGHIECDGLLMDNANIESVPSLDVKHQDAILTHEAIIGKISSAQLLKLMSLGLDEEEATKEIIKGFLK